MCLPNTLQGKLTGGSVDPHADSKTPEVLQFIREHVENRKK